MLLQHEYGGQEEMDREKEIVIGRDGLMLHGRIARPETENRATLIIFHGFGGNLGYDKDDLYSRIVQKALGCGVSAVRFDFSGCGKSEGRPEDMDLFREMTDAIAILNYVRTLPYGKEIYLLGHSMGGVIAGMLAGLYPDVIKKLILLAPAATLKEDAQKGICMGTIYDKRNVPDVVLVDGCHHVGGHFFRIARNLPIYEMTSQFEGDTLLIHGTADALVDYQASVRYHALLKKSKLCLYEKLDHGIEGEDGENALKEIEEFLH